MNRYNESQFNVALAEYELINTMHSIQRAKLNVMKECNDDIIMYNDSISILTEGFANKAGKALKKFFKKIWEYILKVINFTINAFKKRWRDIRHYINLLRSKFTKLPVIRKHTRPINVYTNSMDQLVSDLTSVENALMKVITDKNTTSVPPELTNVINKYHFEIDPRTGKIEMDRFSVRYDLLPDKEYLSIYDPVSYMDNALTEIEKRVAAFETHKDNASKIANNINKYMEYYDQITLYDEAIKNVGPAERNFSDAAMNNDNDFTFSSKGVELGKKLSDDESIPPIVILHNSSMIINNLVNVYDIFVKEAIHDIEDIRWYMEKLNK